MFQKTRSGLQYIERNVENESVSYMFCSEKRPKKKLLRGAGLRDGLSGLKFLLNLELEKKGHAVWYKAEN